MLIYTKQSLKLASEIRVFNTLINSISGLYFEPLKVVGKGIHPALYNIRSVQIMFSSRPFLFLPRPFYTAAIPVLSLIFCLLSFDAIAATLSAETLKTQITALVNSHNERPADSAIIRSIKILTPAEQLTSLCATPELSIAGNNRRLTGNKSIIAQCGNKRKFIQISVQAQGTWWTARHGIKPGSVIEANDIEPRTGSLDRLPAGLIFDRENIVGQTATRTINKGQAVVENQLRKGWSVVSGQEVDVLATGEGFQIRIKAKALDSAAAGQPVRLSTRSGQIVTGMVAPDGKVHINLKE